MRDRPTVVPGPAAHCRSDESVYVGFPDVGHPDPEYLRGGDRDITGPYLKSRGEDFPVLPLFSYGRLFLRHVTVHGVREEPGVGYRGPGAPLLCLSYWRV